MQVTTWTNKIHQLAIKHIPNKFVIFTPSQPHSYNNTIYKLRQKRQKAHHQAIKSKNQHDINNFKRIRNKVKKAIRKEARKGKPTEIWEE